MIDKTTYRKFAKDNIITGFTRFVISASQIFILLPLLTKNLGAYNYGLWSQVNVTIGLVMTFVSLGLPYTLLRFLAAKTDNDEIREEFYSAFFLVLVVAVVSAFLIVVFSDKISCILFDGESHIVKITGLIILVWALDWVVLNLFRAFREMTKYAFFMIGKTVCEIAVIAYFVYNDNGLLAVLLSVFAVRVALFGLLFYLVNRKVPLVIPRFSKIKEYLSFGLPTVPGNISAWVVSSSDRYIIGYYLGATSIGIYSVGYGIGGFIMTIALILGFVLPSTLSNLYDNGRMDEVKITLQYSMKYFFLFAIPFLLGSAVLARNVIVILATDEIASRGYFIVPLIALSSICSGFYVITSQILVLLKKTKTIGVIWLLAALTNILLNLLMIPHWGILGAAIATLIAYSTAMSLVAYFSFGKLRFKIEWGFILKSFIASFIMAFVISRIDPSDFLSILTTIFVAITIYSVVLLLLRGFKKAEYIFFKNLIQRVFS